MLEDLAKVAQEYGLKIHEGKTKARRNVQKGVSLGRLRFRNGGIKILCFEEADNYLVREVSFGDCQARGIENRLAAGWAAFAEHPWKIARAVFVEHVLIQDMNRGHL